MHIVISNRISMAARLEDNLFREQYIAVEFYTAGVIETSSP